MTGYVLAPGAVTDLRDIAWYTRRQWSNAQAIRYRDQLETCFEQLASGKSRPSLLSDLFPDLVMLRCQHHYVFARLRQGRPVTIEAVLHEKMDLLARVAERLR